MTTEKKNLSGFSSLAPCSCQNALQLDMDKLSLLEKLGLAESGINW